MALLSAPIQDRAGSRISKPRLQGYYFSQSNWLKNLGDCIAVVILDHIGYELVPCSTAEENVANAGRCLMPIGSVLDNNSIGIFPGRPIDVWGGGSKGNWLDAKHLSRIKIHAVRGPLTAEALKLPSDIPLGDPALLLPLLVPRTIERHERTLVIPHLSRSLKMKASQRCQITGCDEMIITLVYMDRQYQKRWSVRGFCRMCKYYLLGGLPVSFRTAIEKIGGASFVLTASLHGAILAQAYGIPWAAYNHGYIDAPFKWYDWAAYLGIQLEFVRNLDEGRQWWQEKGQAGRIRDLAPLLASFPHDILNPQLQILAATGKI